VTLELSITAPTVVEIPPAGCALSEFWGDTTRDPATQPGQHGQQHVASSDCASSKMTKMSCSERPRIGAGQHLEHAARQHLFEHRGAGEPFEGVDDACAPGPSSRSHCGQVAGSWPPTAREERNTPPCAGCDVEPRLPGRAQCERDLRVPALPPSETIPIVSSSRRSALQRCSGGGPRKPNTSPVAANQFTTILCVDRPKECRVPPSSGIPCAWEIYGRLERYRVCEECIEISSPNLDRPSPPSGGDDVCACYS